MLDGELYQELRKAYGANAEFRDGQLDAIKGILEGKRLLIVQRTGWGKSLVYFLATKMLRKRGKGISIIISPLLALMNNQINSALKFRLNVVTVNSTNKEEWSSIFETLKTDKADALIVSPERLSNQEFREILVNELTTRIGFFVVDEAHCISDWGHDFRPDYRRIIELVQKMPPNVPILATTATANNRVVNDIRKQLGEDIYISRGSLMRKSLELQVIKLKSKEERLAWLLENIRSLPGTGLIYCLTVRDCQLIENWLKSHDILCACYYGKAKQEDKLIIAKNFMNNKIKVLIATVAFGMGIDKADIGFVIHFQKPGNIVAYYQQIGRAGRGVDRALAILFSGGEDDEINRYFIESAFPTADLMYEVIEIIQTAEGIKLGEIESKINWNPGKIKKCLKYLSVNGDIYEDKYKYYKTPKLWTPDLEHSRKITAIRYKELEQMNEFINTRQCYMEFIASKLDDKYACRCGKCSNCIGAEIVKSSIKKEIILQAQTFIKKDFQIIEPRKRWPNGVIHDGKVTIQEEKRCQRGLVLSNYGDAGWGKVISFGKYKNNYFNDELVEAAACLLGGFIIENNITWVTNISSLRHPELVRSFTIRLTKKLKLPYFDVIIKTKDSRCQKELNNSYMQYQNVFNSFKIENGIPNGNVLLVDDMVDSGWTFTVCGYKLIEKGSGKVFPFALANSAGRNGDD